MFTFVLAVHLFLCVAIIGIVLMQQGKGADLGAAFSGSSNSVFGAAGANNVLVKVTTGAAVLFMITSIVLIRMYDSGAGFRGAPADPLAGSIMVEGVKEDPQAAIGSNAASNTTTGNLGVVESPASASEDAPIPAGDSVAADSQANAAGTGSVGVTVEGGAAQQAN